MSNENHEDSIHINPFITLSLSPKKWTMLNLKFVIKGLFTIKLEESKIISVYWETRHDHVIPQMA